MSDHRKLIDLHCHILPGIDDGPVGDESLAMARLAAADGIATVVATPHQLGAFAHNHGDLIRAGVEGFQRLLQREQVALRILPGAELRIEPGMVESDIVARLNSGELLTLADGRHVLLDLAEDSYVPLERLLAELKAAGFTGILAHPERNREILAQPELLTPLVQAGCLLQVTAGSVLGEFGRESQELADWLIRREMAYIMASDAHHFHFRRPLLSAAFDSVAQSAGAVVAGVLCQRHPAAIISAPAASPKQHLPHHPCVLRPDHQESEGMNVFRRMAPERLQELLAVFPRLRVAVIGDFFLDKYYDIDPALGEPSVETGRIAHQVTAVRRSPGAAGTVVSNLAALGAGKLQAIGLTGDDGDSYDLRRCLAALGCGTEHLHKVTERMTCLYLKPHDLTDPSLAGEHSRLDIKNRVPASLDVQRQIIQSLDALLPELDAVVVADQAEERDCGVITGMVRDWLAAAVRRYPRVVFFADSRRRIREYRGLVIKPNQYETVGRENPIPGDEVSMEEIIAALPALQAMVGGPVCVTRGPAGMIVADREVTLVPGVRLDGPVDPTGAGDSATAGATLALAAGATLPEAALLGNLTASITVQQLATTGTARPDQLPPRLALWQAQQ